MTTKKRSPFVPLCLALGAMAGHAPVADASSFREVRTRVYEKPLTTLPYYELELAKAIGKALWNMSGELIDRARTTLSNTSDFKPAGPKLIHTTGVCAEGTWKIDTATFATGLLAPGATIPAMVRFSVATNDPLYKKGTKRHFGMAVKLFPTSDENEPVLTRNIFTLDQTGLTGDDRKSFFAEFYTNSVAGKGFLSWLGQRTFEKLDPPSTIRALYPLAKVAHDGAEVERAVAPKLIRIVPRVTRKTGDVPADFRDELLQYGAHELKFDVVLPEQYGLTRDTTIGTLELGQPVVSAACDEELTFHHAPDNRELVQP